MGRPRQITESDIRAVLDDLEASGVEPTAAKVRERLGGIGSFTTLSRVMQQWRAEREKVSQTPAPTRPENVERAFSLVWAEATRQATEAFTTEREAFQQHQRSHSKEQAELMGEIERLEKELEAEKQGSARTIQELTAEKTRLSEELQGARVALATAEGALSEVRNRADQEQERNRELSERVIAEAARAQALAARVTELEKDRTEG